MGALWAVVSPWSPGPELRRIVSSMGDHHISKSPQRRLAALEPVRIDDAERQWIDALVRVREHRPEHVGHPRSYTKSSSPTLFCRSLWSPSPIDASVKKTKPMHR